LKFLALGYSLQETSTKGPAPKIAICGEVFPEITSFTLPLKLSGREGSSFRNYSFKRHSVLEAYLSGSLSYVEEHLECIKNNPKDFHKSCVNHSMDDSSFGTSSFKPKSCLFSYSMRSIDVLFPYCTIDWNSSGYGSCWDIFIGIIPD